MWRTNQNRDICYRYDLRPWNGITLDTWSEISQFVTSVCTELFWAVFHSARLAFVFTEGYGLPFKMPTCIIRSSIYFYFKLYFVHTYMAGLISIYWLTTSCKYMYVEINCDGAEYASSFIKLTALSCY